MSEIQEWSKIESRALAFSERWADETSEKSEAHTFLNEFFSVLGIDRKKANAYLEYAIRLPAIADAIEGGESRPKRRPGARAKGADGYIDLYWPGKIIVEMKSSGRSLDDAFDQILKYIAWMDEGDVSFSMPRFAVVCDFRKFIVYDMKSGVRTPFGLDELSEHVRLFGPLRTRHEAAAGEEKLVPVNRDAVDHIKTVHRMLSARKYSGHNLQKLLVRLVYCFFAERTGIFEDGWFSKLLARTAEDGGDLGPWLVRLFAILDTPEDERPDEDPHLLRFPYVNGGLFADKKGEKFVAPYCDRKTREGMIAAGRFDWKRVSPEIFGAMFQEVMEPKQRRDAGAHYTPVDVILKAVKPLILDPLRARFEAAKRKTVGRIEALKELHHEMAAMRFLDPACGCGNFLIVIYGLLRELETEILFEIHGPDVPARTVPKLSLLDVNHFSGIELEPHAALIAETSLWMTDHLQNIALKRRFRHDARRIPLRAQPNIVNGDALAIDWCGVLDPAVEIEVGGTRRLPIVYVVGNPPFKGSKTQAKALRDSVAAVRRDFAAHLGVRLDKKDHSEEMPAGQLDFAAGWLFKAAMYLDNREGGIGLVLTSSLTQGEQVAPIWSPMLKSGMRITHAYRPFLWNPDAGKPDAAPKKKGVKASKKAHVHCVAVGLSHSAYAPEQRLLYVQDDEGNWLDPVRTSAISPYLIDASGLNNPDFVVRQRSRPISDLVSPIVTGNQPIDGGHLIVKTQAELDRIVAAAPRRKPFDVDRLAPIFIGARELLKGQFQRRILRLDGVPPSEYLPNAEIERRLQAVARARRRSRRAETRSLADTPTAYGHSCDIEKSYIAVPLTSSGARNYLPIDLRTTRFLPSNLLSVVRDADKWMLGVMLSSAHMDWMRLVCGRNNNDYRYSPKLVYNTFPWPELDRTQKEELGRLVVDLLAERNDTEQPLGLLYKSIAMSSDLLGKHKAIDRYVDRIMGGLDSRNRLPALLVLHDLALADEAAASRPAGIQLSLLDDVAPIRRVKTRRRALGSPDQPSLFS